MAERRQGPLGLEPSSHLRRTTCTHNPSPVPSHTTPPRPPFASTPSLYQLPTNHITHPLSFIYIMRHWTRYSHPARCNRPNEQANQLVVFSQCFFLNNYSGRMGSSFSSCFSPLPLCSVAEKVLRVLFHSSVPVSVGLELNFDWNWNLELEFREWGA